MMAPQQKAASPWRGQAAYNSTIKSNHSPIDALLSRLEGVKRTGSGTWRARCPAHGSKSLSLAIREADTGATLLHCFAGCTAHEVVGAVGLEITDLFPPRPDDPAYVGKAERRPFPAADILRAIGFEATIVALAGAAIIAGEPFSQFDKDRLLVAVGRINAALDAGGLNHG
ncbi:DNA primase [Thiobacillus sp.]